MSACNELNIINKLVPLVKIIQYLKISELKHSPENDLYRGACFFCKKDNSMVINNEKNCYYCFECHSGGDSVVFLCRKYDISPIELVERVKGPVFTALFESFKDR